MRWEVVLGYALATASVSLAAPTAWVASMAAGTVSRIDLATHTATTVPVGTMPFGVGVSATRVVVGSVVAKTVTMFDTATAAVIATVPMPEFPRGVGVTPDGAKAYVGMEHDEVVVLDGSGAILGTIPVGSGAFLGGMAVSADGTRVYLGKSRFNAASIVVIDTATDTVIADVLLTMDAFGVEGVAVSPDGTRVWASVGGFSSVFVVDATTNLPLGEVPLACTSCGNPFGVAVHPDGSRVYVGMWDRVAIVDAALRLEVDGIPTFGVPASVDVTPDGTRLYAVEVGGGNRIEIFDTATTELVGTLLSLGDDPYAFGKFITPGTTTTTTTLASTSTTSTTTTTTTLPPLPLLGTTARTCQDAIVTSWKRFPVKAHKLFASCFGRVLRDAAGGAGTTDAATACIRSLDPSDPSSALSRTRIAARTQLLSKCAAIAPAALGHPCTVGAADMAAVADCVLDAETHGVARTLAAQYGAPCTLAIAAGIDAMFPALCTATP